MLCVIAAEKVLSKTHIYVQVLHLHHPIFVCSHVYYVLADWVLLQLHVILRLTFEMISWVIDTWHIYGIYLIMISLSYAAW